MSGALFFQVRWFQQQHEKKRKKRDFMPSSFSFDYPTFFDEFGPRPRQTTYHRQRNRGVPLQNLFTDPLFKEQWYLVSGPPFDFTSLDRNELYVTRLCHFWDACLTRQDSKVPQFNPIPPSHQSVFIEFFIDSTLSMITTMVKEENRGIYFL